MNEKKANVREREQRPAAKPRWAKIALSVLKAVWIPLACAVALVIGLWIGYAYIGGRSPADVWQWSTWKHLYDLVFGN